MYLTSKDVIVIYLNNNNNNPIFALKKENKTGPKVLQSRPFSYRKLRCATIYILFFFSRNKNKIEERAN